MKLAGKRIGFGITGSHCTYEEIYPQIKVLLDEGADVIPVVTFTVKNTSTRFGTAGEWVEKIEKLTGNQVIDSIVAAEPLGPKLPLDCMVIAPLTGNSMSKLANALTDS
ncbi:dipicolinate synthase subunit B [Bacillus sp. 7586-K]|nr:dipicolinate synthase subunit B [Bacillus sp. 7586-K]